MIDSKDLRPMKASELKIGGIFYRKDSDGFKTCCIYANEVAHHPIHLREWTKQFSKEGILFVRINKPFSSFA
jgi:hypothetical protein